MRKKFKEVQKFRQWWLLLILIGIGLLPVYGIYKQLLLKENFGNQPMSDLGLIIFTIGIFAFIALFWSMQLTTQIDQHEIKMSFFPFVKKRLSWREIKNIKIVDYGFVGGWGIRLGTKYGTVYNIKGTKGLAIELVNGKKFLIGTQKEIELQKIVDQVCIK